MNENKFSEVSSGGYGHWVYRPESGELSFSESVRDLLGFQDKELVSYNHLRDHICEQDLDFVELAFSSSIEQRRSYIIRYSLCREQESETFIEETGLHLYSDDGRHIETTAFIRDVTTFVTNERDLKLAARVFEWSGESIMVTDAKERIVITNNSFTRHTGYQEKEVKGKTPKILQSGQHAKEFYRAMWEAIEREGYWRGEVSNRRKDGSLFPAELSITPVKDENNRVTNYIGIFNDVSEKKENEEKIRELAHIDSLTMLPNRHSIQNYLDEAISLRNSDELIGVFFIDLDNFKVVNDSLGHHIGDLYLKNISNRLNKKLDAVGAKLARLGGDEFLVVQSVKNKREIFAETGDLILKDIARSIRVGGYVFKPGASVGVAICPVDGTDQQALIQHADTAMYHAKKNGKNNFVLYSQEMSDAATTRLRYELYLRQAIEENELNVVYQPKIDLMAEKITGVEALMRWKSRVLGDVPPTKFIPLAEETGIIHDLGKWLIDRVLSDMASYYNPEETTLRVALNFSPRQFHDEYLVDFFVKKIEEYNINPHLLEVEITETSLMENVDYVRKTLARLRELGIVISIDDFGTGYSSFSQLKNIHVDILKIDREFVSGIEIQENDYSILRGMVSMAQNMGMEVVAEGVETGKQVELLRNAGCNIGQGFYFSHPLNAEDLVLFLSPDSQPENE